MTFVYQQSLIDYMKKHGKKTLEKFIEKWYNER